MGLCGVGRGGIGGVETYRHTALRIIISTQVVKRFAMPRAKQRIMDRIPSLRVCNG